MAPTTSLDPGEQMIRTLRILTDEVIPALR